MIARLVLSYEVVGVVVEERRTHQWKGGYSHHSKSRRRRHARTTLTQIRDLCGTDPECWKDEKGYQSKDDDQKIKQTWWSPQAYHTTEITTSLARYAAQGRPGVESEEI